MKGLFLFIGESFRYGKQDTRTRGHQISYAPQMQACQSHIELLNRMKSIGVEPSVVLATYTTQFDEDLCRIYKPYMHTILIMNEAAGFTYLFNRALDLILDLQTFDFVMYIRIDIQLHPECIQSIDPTRDTIVFPNVLPQKTKYEIPFVNDMFAYIPIRYIQYFRKIPIYHTMWNDLLSQGLPNSSVHFMLDTYYDSDTNKDTHPFYTIVNRPKAKSRLYAELPPFLKDNLSNIQPRLSWLND